MSHKEMRKDSLRVQGFTRFPLNHLTAVVEDTAEVVTLLHVLVEVYTDIYIDFYTRY